jgi:hypothetical protein
MSEDTNDSALRDQLVASYAQFAPIRQRFSEPGVERGGHERAGVTPVWVRTFGAHADVLLQGAKRYLVEASFDAAQLAAINAAIIALKSCVGGGAESPPFADQVVARYLDGVAPAFALALLRATEDLLRAFVERYPAQVCALDALMRVAGGEGLRDLVRKRQADLTAEEKARLDGLFAHSPQLKRAYEFREQLIDDPASYGAASAP